MEYLWAILAGTFAFLLGRSFIVWSLMGYLIGWPVAIAVFFFGVKVESYSRRMGYIVRAGEWIEERNRPKEYKDFDNVQDLFQQLDNK